VAPWSKANTALSAYHVARCTKNRAEPALLNGPGKSRCLHVHPPRPPPGAHVHAHHPLATHRSYLCREPRPATRGGVSAAPDRVTLVDRGCPFDHIRTHRSKRCSPKVPLPHGLGSAHRGVFNGVTHYLDQRSSIARARILILVSDLRCTDQFSIALERATKSRAAGTTPSSTAAREQAEHLRRGPSCPSFSISVAAPTFDQGPTARELRYALLQFFLVIAEVRFLDLLRMLATRFDVRGLAAPSMIGVFSFSRSTFFASPRSLRRRLPRATSRLHRK